MEALKFIYMAFFLFMLGFGVGMCYEQSKYINRLLKKYEIERLYKDTIKNFLKSIFRG